MGLGFRASGFGLVGSGAELISPKLRVKHTKNCRAMLQKPRV